MKTWPLIIGIIVILALVCSPVLAISKSDLISYYKGQSVPIRPTPTPTPTPIPTTVPTTVQPQTPSIWPLPLVPEIYSKRADLPPKCCANESNIGRRAIEPQPTPTFGSLEISSDPSGASAYLNVNPWTNDGTFIGTTPVTVRVETGTHQIKLIKTGYSGVRYISPVYGTNTIEVTVTEGETVRVSAMLIPGYNISKGRLI